MNKRTRIAIATHQFGRAMERKLIRPENLAKPDWRGQDIDYLRDRLVGEMAELLQAVGEKGDLIDKRVILGECVDVANFAMFIADKIGALGQ